MLKIRIAGTEGELRQIAHKAGSTRIKRFKRNNGKTTFAIDVEISVKDFLNNLDLSNAEGSQSSNAKGSQSSNAKGSQSNNAEGSQSNNAEGSQSNNAEGSQLNTAESSENNASNKCNSKEIQLELEALLEEISDK